MTRFADRVRLLAAGAVAAGAVAIGLAAGGSGGRPAAAQEKVADGKAAPAGKPDPLLPKEGEKILADPGGCIRCHGAKTRAEAADDPVYGKVYKSHEFVHLTESTKWREEDAHSAAYEVLSSPLGKRMQAALKYEVTKSVACLTCHATDRYPGSPLPPGPIADGKRFQTTTGIACNVCHGLREDWNVPHSAGDPDAGVVAWRALSPEQKEEKGLRNLRDPVVKAKLCASCHVGSAAEGKVVTHDMYAAGHPPLPPFELASYLEGEPKHWGYPTDPELKFFASVAPAKTWGLYRFHPAKDESYLSRHYAAGAVVALRAEAEMILEGAKASARDGEVIDFARFDCYSCHHDLVPDSDRQRRGFEGRPGVPTLRAAASVPAGLVAAHAAEIPTGGLADKAKGFDGPWLALRSAATTKPFGHAPTMAKEAAAVVKWCDEFLDVQSKCTEPLYTTDQHAPRLRRLIADAAGRYEVADPEVAMSLGWAHRTLNREAGAKWPAGAEPQFGAAIPLNVREAPYSAKVQEKGKEVARPVTAQFDKRMRMVREFDVKRYHDALKLLPAVK